jgi:hypothetical protein
MRGGIGQHSSAESDVGPAKRGVMKEEGWIQPRGADQAAQKQAGTVAL